MTIDGRLERGAAAGGAINIVARRVSAMDVDDRVRAQVKDFDLGDAMELDRQVQQHTAGSDDFAPSRRRS